MLWCKQTRIVFLLQKQLKKFYSTKNPFENIKIKTFETILNKEEPEIDFLAPDYVPQKIEKKIKPKIDKKKLILERFKNENEDEIYKILFLKEIMKWKKKIFQKHQKNFLNVFY